MCRPWDRRRYTDGSLCGSRVTWKIPRKDGVVYVNRMVNLTFPSPDIVAPALQNTLPPDLTLVDSAVGWIGCGPDSKPTPATARPP